MIETRRRWNRSELLVALNVYHKLNFGQFHKRNPVIIDIATRLQRTPGSLAMKLGNFASLDPVLKLRNIRGLEGASNLDREMWNEFHRDPETLAPQSEEALHSLFEVPADATVECIKTEGVRIRNGPPPPEGPTESERSVKVRRGQQYFREVVLNNFNRRCGVTQIAIDSLLVASHILPWATHSGVRLECGNGLCLSRLHDAAFDQGLISFDDELRLIVGDRINEQRSNPSVEHNFFQFKGTPLVLASESIPPRMEHLAAHRQKRFNRDRWEE